MYDRVGLFHDVANRTQQRRMQYFGHVQRMDHTRYPKLVLSGYVHGTRKQGRPKKRWTDMVKDDCRQRDLDIHQATEMIHHRLAWRSLVRERYVDLYSALDDKHLVLKALRHGSHSLTW